MDDPIFELDSPCRKAAKYKGMKMKDMNKAAEKRKTEINSLR